MNISCDKRDVCLPPTCDTELASPFSAEAQDSDRTFCYSSHHDAVEPGAGRNWQNEGCGSLAPCQIIFGPLTCAENSEAECDSCLSRSQTTCGDPPQSTIVDADCNALQVFCNTEQTCEVSCPDGTQFSYTVPAGVFCLGSQDLSDQAALSLARQRAAEQMLCIGFVSNYYCVGSGVAVDVELSGVNSPTATVEIVGSLPPGISISGQSLVGIPTTPGFYPFAILARDINGNTAVKSAWMAVAQVLTPSVLPDGTVGTAYSESLLETGAGLNHLWTVISGALPDGLALAGSTGVISGTPTTYGTFNFTIGLWVNSGAQLVCQTEYTMTVNPVTTVFAYFKLDEADGAADLVDSVAAANLANSTGAMDSVPGKIGTGMELGNAINTRFQNGPDAHWVFSGSFTVRFWFKTPGTSTNGYLLGTGVGNQWDVFYDPDYPNMINFLVYTTGGTLSILAPVTNDAQWHEYVFWFEAGVGIGAKVDNGVAITSAGTDPISPPATLTLYLQNTHFWDPGVQIDEIAIWNRKLTDAEMTFDWSSGNGKTYPDVP